MIRARSFVYALIGAVLSLLLSFIPFSTIVGGAIAGFLEGTDTREGTMTGALSGVIMFVPFLGILFLALAALGIGVGTAVLPTGGFAIGTVFVLLVTLVVFLYTVGLAAIGGFLGAYIAREYPEQQRKTKETLTLEERDRPPLEDRHTGDRERERYNH